LFSVNRSNPEAIEGFGSVFDGLNVPGNLANVSTQAVLEMFKNVQEDASSFVAIDMNEIEQFNISGVATNSEVDTEQRGN